ncbi:MAG: hypothetical protein OXC82_08240 [Rhodobacteraceae bacterium]|nr:hypothetical protein [Paracoccaceae bacterium]
MGCNLGWNRWLTHHPPQPSIIREMVDIGGRGRLPAPGPGAGEAKDIFGWGTIPWPMDNQAGRINDGVDRAGKPHAGTNERDAARHEQAGGNLEEFDNRMAEANRVLEEFNRSVEARRRKYKRMEWAIEQLQKAVDRLRAAAERIREHLTVRMKPKREKNRMISQRVNGKRQFRWSPDRLGDKAILQLVIGTK